MLLWHISLVSLQMPNLNNQIASLSAREVFTFVYVVESSILVYRFMDRKSLPSTFHSNKNHKISDVTHKFNMCFSHSHVFSKNSKMPHGFLLQRKLEVLPGRRRRCHLEKLKQQKLLPFGISWHSHGKPPSFLVNIINMVDFPLFCWFSGG